MDMGEQHDLLEVVKELVAADPSIVENVYGYCPYCDAGEGLHQDVCPWWRLKEQWELTLHHYAG